MNWDAIGAIGQVLGSVAVFITLVYLAIQTRHARSESQRALSQGRAEAFRDLNAQLSDERINRLHVKADAALGGQPNPFVSALMEKAGFTREEAALMFWIHLQYWNYRVQMIANVDELNPIDRAQFDIGMRRQLGEPGIFRLFYEIVSASHPDVDRYIDNLLAQPS
jgi:hypothetical protein